MSDPTILSMPRHTVLLPLAWVLRSGWVSVSADILEVDDDEAAVRALTAGSCSLALIDPLHWARNRAALRPVPRTAVTLGPGGSDMHLLSSVRLDGLERVTTPQLPPGTGEEAVARTLVREYYGVSEPLREAEEGRVEGEEGRLVTGAEALRDQPFEFVESLSKAWWITSGTPWVRALVVERAGDAPEPTSESLLKEIERHLREQADTVATALARQYGGAEQRWLDLIQALSLSYGAEERKGLGTLLAQAARLRLAPRVDDAALPRY